MTNLGKGVTFDGNKACFAAAVYTQTTDVETEVNGLMTYDREVLKIDEERIRKANRKMIESNSETTDILMPRSQQGSGHDELYNAYGMRIDHPAIGMNILRRADGSIVKYIHQ